jgi:uncharacterized protein YfdQ (DUF2303 family)
MFDKEAIQELAKAQAITAAAEAIGHRIDSSSGAIALPDDFNLHDLEPYQPTRRRARGTMTTSRLEDWAAYVEIHKEGGAAAFVNPAHMQAVCVLNLGTPVAPGHADNLAIYKPETTAAYDALRAIESTSGQTRRLTQRSLAEWMEDWAERIVCVDAEGTAIDRRKATAAVRAITIESASKAESVEGQLSVERSSFEQVKATSKDTLPAVVQFACEPYHGLRARTFELRLSIITGEKEPMLVLRTIRAEWHREEMAIELALNVRKELADKVPVALGSYTTK